MSEYSCCLTALILILLCLLSGCGVYSFTGQGIAGIESVSVEPFANQTSEFGLCEQMMDAIVTRLLKDRTLTVANRSSADAVLTGTLVAVEDKPLTYSEAETVSEYIVTITVEFRLMKPDREEPVWSGRLVASGNYPYSSGSLAERQTGLDKALDQLATDLLNRLTSDW